MSALLGFGADGAIRVCVSKPVKCRCGQMAYLLVNRNGRSQCGACDSKSVEQLGYSETSGHKDSAVLPPQHRRVASSSDGEGVAA